MLNQFGGALGVAAVTVILQAADATHSHRTRGVFFLVTAMIAIILACSTLLPGQSAAHSAPPASLEGPNAA